MYKDVLSIIHSPDPNKVRSIWWYNVLEGRMEDYSLLEVEKHNDSRFTTAKQKSETGWIKGRILGYENKLYLMIYSIGYKAHPTFLVERIIQIFSKKFLIDFVINESGESLNGMI